MVEDQQPEGGGVFDVLRVTPPDADSLDLWIDRETRRIGRIVAGEEFAVPSDYRSFHGVCTATSGRQGGGDPANEIVLHVETVEVGPVSAKLFAPPQTAATP